MQTIPDPENVTEVEVKEPAPSFEETMRLLSSSKLTDLQAVERTSSLVGSAAVWEGYVVNVHPSMLDPEEMQVVLVPEVNSIYTALACFPGVKDNSDFKALNRDQWIRVYCHIDRVLGTFVFLDCNRFDTRAPVP